MPARTLAMAGIIYNLVINAGRLSRAWAQ